MADQSLTDLTAVRPRGPKIFLGVLGLLVVAGAAWWMFLRASGPIGEPEDPAKILVVGTEEARAGIDVLGDHGFEITGVTLAEAEAKAKDVAGGETGAAAALKYADSVGIGYVAFAAPSELSLADVDLAAEGPAITAAQRWVVLSVGDLGIPHVVTVGRTDETIVDVPSWVELMRAIFEQERPAATLFAESQLPMDAIELHKKVSSAVEMHGAYNALETSAKKFARERKDRLVDHEVAEPKPVILATTLEQTTALPLANGGLLALVRPRVVDDAFDAKVRLTELPSTQLWFHPPGKWSPADRVRCSALRGGTLPPGAGQAVLDDTGTVLALDAGDRVDVWRIDPGSKGCDFVRLGSVPYSADDETGGTLYSPGGRALRLKRDDDVEGARIHDPAGSPIDVDFPGCTSVGQPSWVDDDHVAVVCVHDPEVAQARDDDGRDEDDALEDDEVDDEEDDPAEADDPRPSDTEPEGDDVAEGPPPLQQQSWLYVVEVDTTKIAAIPLAGPNPEHAALRLRRAGWGGPVALLTGPDYGQQVTGRLRATTPAAALLALPPADAALASPPFITPADPTIVALSADALTYEALGVHSDGRWFDTSPDGTQIVLERSPEGHHDPNGYDIVVVDLAHPDAERSVAASDRAGHNEPRFTADGAAVVFASRYPVDVYGGLEQAAQIVSVGSSR
jgi:hypothetical protein